MALISLAQSQATMPVSFGSNPAFGTVPTDVATSIFARQSQADLDQCLAYCNRKWPGDADCIAGCRDSVSRSNGLADAGDFFAGAIAAASDPNTLQSNITDLYSQVATPAWASNTGINPAGTVVNTPVINSQVDTSNTSSTWLIIGGAATVALLAWLVLSR